MDDVTEFHRLFYETADKIVQDNFILKFASVCPIQRIRNPGSNRPRTMSAVYYIKRSNKEVVPICRSAFLGILNITKHRVEGVLKRFFEKGEMPKEKRGGDHRSHAKNKLRKILRSLSKDFQY